MGYKELFAVLLLVGCGNAQLRICAPSSAISTCQNLIRDNSEGSCTTSNTRVECAAKLIRGDADLGLFNEEEVLLLGQIQDNNNLRVVASVKDVNKQEDFAFETVAVVSINHSNGFEGLRGGSYCHPGFGAADIRWSPRVMRGLETLAARTDRCEGNIDGKTAEEVEVETLSNFFSAACRPGPWSANTTVDTDLKNRFPNLCSLCSAGGVCAGYNMDSAISIAGVQNSNRHIQALECLMGNGTVAYVAWQHVRDFFNIRNPNDRTRFALLCENGDLAELNDVSLASTSAPCSLIRQPWSAIVTTAVEAESRVARIRNWFPADTVPARNTWQASAFDLLGGTSNTRFVFEEMPVSPLNYTSRHRQISNIDSVSSCMPARRWCTTSAKEQEKCMWLRAASYSLGLQPAISCQQRTNVFTCLTDAMESRVDFFSMDSHYGYLARKHYQLSAVKLVQNSRDYISRIGTLVKTNNTEITRFANLKDGVACFPEFGGLEYVAFIRTAHRHSVISDKQCNYARAVGEFFSNACAPGALSGTHSISDDKDFVANNLCSACQRATPPTADGSNFTCAYDWTNAFFGNNGSLNCLNSPNTDVAFVQMQNINAQLQTLRIDPNSFRVLCQNDSLAVNPGITGIDDACLLTTVVDAEVVTRRNDPMRNSINTLLDALEDHFGYSAGAEQLINFHLFSPFDGVSDLLFKDSTIGLAEPSLGSTFSPAVNYMQLFSHLESCTSDASARSLLSMVTLVVMGIFAKFVV